METIHTIKDTRVRVRISSDLLDILKDNKARITQPPKNISKALKAVGIDLPRSDKEKKGSKSLKPNSVNTQLLNDILSKTAKSNNPSPAEKKDDLVKDKQTEILLCLEDLCWLNQFLCSLRTDGITEAYLNDLLEYSHLELPQNEVIQRDPVLEARCQRLREEQQNREYRNMTKNVDATLKHYPEDTIAYQMHAINSQIIAVLQFVFSVAAGFVFGFLGIELIIGELDFGLRLLLGVMIALIIALAEIYFLAKKLNEYDNTIATAKKAISKTVPAKKPVSKQKPKKKEANKKAHKD